MLDGLVHTRPLLASSGNITDRYRYDAWGNPIEQVGTTFNPFRWNAAYGYEWTAAISLYHVGARESDPRTARWLQRDPIDIASGDPNLYRYCGNDPINYADPSGCAPQWIHGSLDLIGLYPGIGELADLLNAGLYALEGDWANAAISGVGVIPILGDIAKVGRWVKRVWDISHVVLYERAGSKALRALRPSEEAVCETSRAARREAMRRAGIPTCQQPVRQGGRGDYRWYRYKDNKGLDAAVVHHPADDLHPYPHWETGHIKIRGGKIQRNPYGVPRLESSKKKVPYRR